MLNKEPGPERAQFGFKEAVLANFKFLSDFGLRPVDEKVTLVRYESAGVFVSVYHGRASFELGVEVGKLKEPESRLSVFDLVRWAGAEKSEGFGQHVMFQVSSREDVQEFVPKLAALVKKYAVPFLRGDEDAYRTALESRAKRYAEEVKEGNFRVVRSKADAAWKAKDYAQVVELYGPVRQDLTEVEAKKLAYAEQQVLAAEGAGPRSSSRKRR
jgi:hypothetical protein